MLAPILPLILWAHSFTGHFLASNFNLGICINGFNRRGDDVPDYSNWRFALHLCMAASCPEYRNVRSV